MGFSGSTPGVTQEETQNVFSQLDEPYTPLTVAEVAEKLECSNRTAQHNLETLAEHGELQTKQIDGQSQVWWWSEDGHDSADRQPEVTEFNRFVNAVEDYAIFMLDPQGTIVSWNDGAEQIKGYTETEILGEHLSTFYTDTDINNGVVETNLETAAAEGRLEDKGWRVRKDGSRFWADVVITAIKDDDGTLQGFTKVTRDMTEQREYEHQLRQERDLIEQILETSPIGIFLVNESGEITLANDRMKDILDVTDEELSGLVHSAPEFDFIKPNGEPISDAELPVVQARQTREAVFGTEIGVTRPDDQRLWLSINAVPLPDDQSDKPTKTVATLEDITDRKQANDALARINIASRELMDAEPQTISKHATAIVQEVLDVAYTSLWRYDETAGKLQLRTSSTASDVNPDTIQHPEKFEKRAWQVFISTEMDTSNDLAPTSDSTPSEEPIRSGVILPLGRHGVIYAGSLSPEAFDETTVDLAETVAATIETALDRAADKQQLATHNEELTRLDQINSIIRDIDQALVEAETRVEINRVVCDRLAQSDRYHSAWFGEYDLATETITPQEWAGIKTSYFEALTDTTDDTSLGQGPIGTAAHTHEVQVIEDIATDARFAPWREQTLASGARSGIIIPLVYNEVLYGILTVYANSPLPETDDHTVLGELGETIAHAINAVETQEILHTDSVIELSLRFQNPDTPLCQLAQHADCQIDFEKFIPQADGPAHVFFTARGVSLPAIQTAAETAVAIEELTCLAERDNEFQFKAAVAGLSLPSLLVEQDAVIRTFTIEGETATAVVDLPSTASVREFIEDIQMYSPAMDFHSRHTRDRPINTSHTFRTTIDNRLTDRQQEILQTAYVSGFFQSPREHTGKEIAAMLDISPPTFTQHLRAGQHNLFELLFDDA